MDEIKNTIRVLKMHYDFLKQMWKPYPDPNVLNAIGSAVSLLEKRIPKKPQLEGDGYADGQLVYDTWICPACGQAIDWSEYVGEKTEEK